MGVVKFSKDFIQDPAASTLGDMDNSKNYE